MIVICQMVMLLNLRKVTILHKLYSIDAVSTLFPKIYLYIHCILFPLLCMFSLCNVLFASHYVQMSTSGLRGL